MEIAIPSPATRAAIAVGLLSALLAWETARPYFALFGQGAKPLRSRLRHGALNLALGALNVAVVSLVFAGIWLAVTGWTAKHNVGLLNWRELPLWSRIALSLLLLDAWTYFWHWLNHRVPFFWRFHRWHHADRAMDVTTASRFHTVEIGFSSILRIPVLALIGCRIEELALYELLLFAVVQFHHANIALPDRLDRALRLFFVTPSLHKVHHSVVRAESDSNYASLFSWWDAVFRTRRILASPREIVFGVEE